MAKLTKSALLEAQDRSQIALRKSVALTCLCSLQVDGEVKEEDRAEWGHVVSTVNRIDGLLELAIDEGVVDVSVDAHEVVCRARAITALLLQDMKHMGEQHSSDEIMSWCFWALRDEIKIAAEFVEGSDRTEAD